MIELKIKVSGDDQTLVEKHLIFSTDIRLCQEDAVLHKLVTDVIKKFQGSVDEVVLMFRMEW